MGEILLVRHFNGISNLRKNGARFRKLEDEDEDLSISDWWSFLVGFWNDMGLSENSVPLNPVWLMIIIPMKNGYFIGNIPNIFRHTHMSAWMQVLGLERRPGVSEPEGPDGQRGHSLAALATPMRFLTA